MTELELILPRRGRVELHELIPRIEAQHPALPFEERLVDTCARFSRAIFEDREARRYPELQALAFRMRKSELARLRDAFWPSHEAETEPVPRGVVFQIPPANVDTIFIYCWMFSALAGNVNLIRLPERAGPAAAILCRLLDSILDDDATTTVVRYGHDAEITGALSKIADVRVIWGGDASIARIREAPIGAQAKELTFADRGSLSVLDAARFNGLAQEEQARLAEKFFNDAFWFDQMACSSPRWIVWRGAESAAADAGSRFAESLCAEAKRRGHAWSQAARLARFTFACRAILEAPVASSLDRAELTLLDFDSPAAFPAEHSGGGLFYQARIASLDQLACALSRRHQTLTHFGFAEDELRALARTIRGRALDRMVPVGQALEFHRFWDGYDLLREFTRPLHIVP